MDVVTWQRAKQVRTANQEFNVYIVYCLFSFDFGYRETSRWTQSMRGSRSTAKLQMEFFSKNNASFYRKVHSSPYCCALLLDPRLQSVADSSITPTYWYNLFFYKNNEAQNDRRMITIYKEKKVIFYIYYFRLKFQGDTIMSPWLKGDFIVIQGLIKMKLVIIFPINNIRAT